MHVAAAAAADDDDVVMLMIVDNVVDELKSYLMRMLMTMMVKCLHLLMNYYFHLI